MDKQNNNKSLRLRILILPLAAIEELIMWLLAYTISRISPKAALRIVTLAQTYLPNKEWYFAKH
jgi:hypothetical protein